MVTWRLWAVVSLTLGCASGTADAPDAGETQRAVVDVARPETPAEAPTALPPRELAIRLSIDLRGVRPTPEELGGLSDLASMDTPGAEEAVGVLVDAWLGDPRFPKRVRDLFVPVFRTRVEDFPVPATALGLSPDDQPALFASIGEEALRVVAQVAAEDRPWTDLVTSAETRVDDRLAAIWPVERTGAVDADGWGPARYTDDRPAAGLLSTNGLWWRYLSDGASHGRGRANAVARLFLCSDFLGRPIDFPRELDLTDAAAIAQAVRQNAGCVGCHAALDPLASALAGLQYTDKTPGELSRYHAERERGWVAGTGAPPGFYGTPTWSLAELGRQLAADPRFVECAVSRGFELLVGRPARIPDELDALTRHREAFLAGGLTIRALFRSVVRDPAYRDASTERLVTPEVWADQLEAWTGFRLRAGGADLLATDRTGLRTLAGGGDGRSGAAAATAPTTTQVLVWQRTAEAAAAWAAEHPQGLFAVDPAALPQGASAADDPAFRAQLQAWHRRFFGREVAQDALEVTAPLALWDALAAIDSPRAAWAGVLTALLRDPDLVVY